MAERIYVVRGVKGTSQFSGVVITPESVMKDQVTIAWSHAVRYTAKGYDLPDYEAALASVGQRHPDWKVSSHGVVMVDYDPSKADIEKSD